MGSGRPRAQTQAHAQAQTQAQAHAQTQAQAQAQPFVRSRQKPGRRQSPRMVQLVYLALGAVLGGLAAHLVGPLDPAQQHVIEGAVTGAVVGLVLEQWIQHRGRLTPKTLKVEVPLVAELEFGIVEAKGTKVEHEFSLTEAQRQVGWRVYVELVSRVATQEVADGTGTLRGSLQSLYDLMQAVRADLRDFPPGPPPRGSADSTVETVACWILNAARAVLAKWHQRLKDHEAAGASESTFAAARECERDLARAREVLRGYAEVLAKILGVQPPRTFRVPTPPRPGK